MGPVEEEVGGRGEVMEDLCEMGETPGGEVGGVHRGERRDGEEVTVGSRAEIGAVQGWGWRCGS